MELPSLYYSSQAMNLKAVQENGLYLRYIENQDEFIWALLHKDLKCKAPLIEPNLRRNLGKWST